MKKLVNGVEAELAGGNADIRRLGDRLMVSTPEGTFSAVAARKGDAVHVSYRGRQYTIEPVRAVRTGASALLSGEVKSPMPGQVVEVLVQADEIVTKGQRLLVLEAMKTQQTFVAPFDGRIARLTVSKGEQVDDGTLMVLVEPAKDNKVE